MELAKALKVNALSTLEGTHEVIWNPSSCAELS
jgi:hypothetical protein